MGHSLRIISIVTMMSKIFAFALLVASTQARFTLKIKNTPEVIECMAGTSDWFSNIQLNVSPYPVDVGAGKTITLEGQIDLNQVVETGSKLALKLKGKIPVIGEIPIPCLEISPDLHLGSCTYDIAGDLLPLLEGSGMCADFMPEGQACALPLNPGQYAGGEPITLTLPDIPDILIPILSPLKAIDAEITGMKADGTAVACLGAKLELTVG